MKVITESAKIVDCTVDNVVTFEGDEIYIDLYCTISMSSKYRTFEFRRAGELLIILLDA
jgi:hypothetical protein